MTQNIALARPVKSADASAGLALPCGSLFHKSPEEEFASAMDAYKRSSGRMFPTWSEVLEVLGTMGYRKFP